MLKQFPKYFIWLIYLFVLSHTSINSHAVPNQAQLDNLKPIGAASLRVLWFDVYDATLFNATGKFEENSVTANVPMALELIYLRKISSKSLIKETEKQLSGKIDKETLKRGLDQLSKIWPNISKKDSLTFYLEGEDTGHFYHNSNYLGTIGEPGFARAFIDIWIGEDCQYPQLAMQLKGLKKN